ncbi:DUF4192 domain-containing protein [Acrocarpospora catenulata]|uniref:DUF4192 domain-containing protein n=1 Tax=Acrocarpospora catenulata TaxID=2836182 RepID=UPI00202396B9|nr:DUF4192 domain-containing protein [Acrocarpospora catenulata]
MSSASPRLRLSSATDILAAVPFLLGFHPERSLVVIGFVESWVRVSTRWDLPPEPGIFAGLVPLLRREKVTMTVLIGYGPGPLVTAAADEVTRLLREEGIQVQESLRADNGRYWSYLCTRPSCCPPDGTPYDPVASPVAAQAIVHGMVALPDRQALERSVIPRSGSAREAMDQATERAAATLRTTLSAGKHANIASQLIAEGITRVRSTIDLYTSGGRLDDDEAARLGFDLALIRVRDEAWTLIDDREVHRTLWQDLTRRLTPHHVAPAASLLAATAWRQGDCALASIALHRALAADPAYSMATLLTQAIHHLLPPELLRDNMPTPEALTEEMGTPNPSWLVPLLKLLSTPSR